MQDRVREGLTAGGALSQHPGRWGVSMADSVAPARRRLGDLPAEEREAFGRKLAFENFQRVTHLAWVFLGLSAFFLAFDWANYSGGLWAVTPAYATLFHLHVVFALAILCWLLLSMLLGPRSEDQARRLHANLTLAMLFFVLLWATAVSLTDQLIHGEISAFVMGCLAVSILAVFTLGQSLLLYLPALALFLTGVILLQDNPGPRMGNLVNGVTVSVLSWVLSRVFYGTRLRLFQDGVTIRRQQGELQRMAVEDFLTGLFNRRYLHSYLAQEFARCRRHGHPLTLAIGDLDGFKAVNDFVSHEAGDRVLSAIAALLRETVRASDVVARYGGDEFVIVFPETPAESARVVCERVREAIEKRVWEELGPDFHLTVSFGLCSELTLDNHEKMLAAADARLHEAKQCGRNLVLV